MKEIIYYTIGEKIPYLEWYRSLDKSLKLVVDKLFMDDTVDLIEEMPSNVVKRILKGVNKEYRKKDYVADIITFAIFADSEEKFVFDGEINLGEIIISLDKVNENSQKNSTSF